MQFRYLGVVARLLADTGETVEPGQIIETDKPINHPEFEEIHERGSD